MFDDQRWLVVMLDGRLTARQLGLCFPSIDERQFAINLCKALNRKHARKGRWAVAWTDPVASGAPTRLAMGWQDPDGDIPYWVDCEDGTAAILAAGVDHFVDQCCAAHDEYLAMLRDVDVKPDQQVKRAQGQPYADPSVEQMPA